MSLRLLAALYEEKSFCGDLKSLLAKKTFLNVHVTLKAGSRITVKISGKNDAKLIIPEKINFLTLQINYCVFLAQKYKNLKNNPRRKKCFCGGVVFKI